jgi:tryptophan synthase alpha subunit
LPDFLARVRRGTGGRPLGVGFGITTRAQVQAVGELADAVVIGSAIISAIDAGAGENPARSVREFVEDVTGH